MPTEDLNFSLWDRAKFNERSRMQPQKLGLPSLLFAYLSTTGKPTSLSAQRILSFVRETPPSLSWAMWSGMGERGNPSRGMGRGARGSHLQTRFFGIAQGKSFEEDSGQTGAAPGERSGDSRELLAIERRRRLGRGFGDASQRTWGRERRLRRLPRWRTVRGSYPGISGGGT